MQFAQRVFEKKNEEKDFFNPIYLCGFWPFSLGLSRSTLHVHQITWQIFSAVIRDPQTMGDPNFWRDLVTLELLHIVYNNG